MKRLIVCSILGLCGAGLLVGCGEETKVKKTDSVSTPTGSTTKTTEQKVETKGNSPPKVP